jgi:Spy/CpxP family protein refolding chaperone
MLGFVLGTACLIGLIKVLRRGGYHGRFGEGGYRCGPGPGVYGGRWRGFGGPRSWLRSIFERLETTPGQEKVILSAVDELRSSRGAVREELGQTRAELARAVATGLVEDTTLEETFARHDRLLAQMRVSFVEAMKKISEALDERQRKQLAQLLEGRGWFGGGQRWSDSYRDVWA